MTMHGEWSKIGRFGGKSLNCLRKWSNGRKSLNARWNSTSPGGSGGFRGVVHQRRVANSIDLDDIIELVPSGIGFGPPGIPLDPPGHKCCRKMATFGEKVRAMEDKKQRAALRHTRATQHLCSTTCAQHKPRAGFASITRPPTEEQTRLPFTTDPMEAVQRAARQETCTYCGENYPWPIQYHHDEAECVENQLRAPSALPKRECSRADP